MSALKKMKVEEVVFNIENCPNYEVTYFDAKDANEIKAHLDDDIKRMFAKRKALKTQSEFVDFKIAKLWSERQVALKNAIAIRDVYFKQLEKPRF